MSDQGEDSETDSPVFIMFLIGGFIAPIVFFSISQIIPSLYLERTLWKPFWKRYTDTVEGRVCIRVIVVPVIDEDGGILSTREIKHAIIDYDVNGISMQRTFFVGDHNRNEGGFRLLDEGFFGFWMSKQSMAVGKSR